MGILPEIFVDSIRKNGLSIDLVPRPPIAMAIRHAPKGGVTIRGKKFKGGQFIPSSVIEQLTTRELAKLEEADGRQKKRNARGADRATQGAGSKKRGLRDRGGVRRSGGRVAPSNGADSSTKPLEGLPTNIEIPGYPDAKIGPFAPARRAAEEYMKSMDFEYRPPKKYANLDRKRARKVAEEFAAMPHDPQNPVVKAAYRAMIDETVAQWEVIEKTGLQVEWITLEMLETTGDPYAATPRLATEDIRRNNHFWCFPTDLGFGSDDEFDPEDNPLLEKTGHVIGGKEVCANDIFRIVHDYFGHAKEGFGFRAEGEENAWRAHSAMYSPLARAAMTTETRGQNSWVNFGPKGKFNRTASAGDTVYADQKVNILPEWVVNDGAADEDYRRMSSLVMSWDESKHPRDLRGRWARKGKLSEADTFLGKAYSRDGQRSGEVVLNPSRKTVKELSGTEGLAIYSGVRAFLLEDGDIAVFPAKILHNDAKKIAGATEDSIPLVLATDRGKAHEAMVSDYSQQGKWHNNKRTAEAIRQHPGLRKVASRHGIGIGYYNQSATGDWERMSSLRMSFDESKHPRAPVGGVTIDGHHYPGGEFIPIKGLTQKDVNKAAREQRSPAKGKGVGQTDKTGKKEDRVTAAEKYLSPDYRIHPEEEKKNPLDPDSFESNTGIEYVSGKEKPTVKPTGRRGEVLTEDVAAFLQDNAGKPIDLGVGNIEKKPKVLELIAKRIADEVEYALADPKSAAEWYKSTIEEAMDTMRRIYPEMEKDPGTEAIFKMVLAITSNGQDVDKNISLAMDAYESWRQTGSFGNPRPGGPPAPNILRHLGLLEDLIDRHGVDGVADFLEQEFTIAEINDAIAEPAVEHLKKMTGRDSFTKKQIEEALKEMGIGFVKGELIKSRFKVRGAFVFGSKLGSFFGNLSGHWDTITMDRWFMRTMGRATGTLLTVPESKLRGQLERSLIGLRGGEILTTAKQVRGMKSRGQRFEVIGEERVNGKPKVRVRILPAIDDDNASQFPGERNTNELTNIDSDSLAKLKKYHKRSKSIESFVSWLRKELIKGHEESSSLDFRDEGPLTVWIKAKHKQYAGDAVFSPTGGAIVDEVFYEEGEEIPSDVIESMTRKEKKRLGLNIRSFSDKTFLNMANKNIWVNISKTNDTPRNGTHRDNIRKVFERVGKIYKERTGKKISNAVMQAALWYFEKRLFQNLGAPAARSAPTDYATEARKHLVKEAPREEKVADRKRRRKRSSGAPAGARRLKEKDLAGFDEGYLAALRRLHKRSGSKQSFDRWMSEGAAMKMSLRGKKSVWSLPNRQDTQADQARTDLSSQMSKGRFMRFISKLMSSHKKLKKKRMSSINMAAAWDASKHPRGGNPKNRGQFSKGRGSSGAERKVQIQPHSPMRIGDGAVMSHIPTKLRDVHIKRARRALGQELAHKVARQKPGEGGEVELTAGELEKILQEGIVGFISAGRNPANPKDVGLTDKDIEMRYVALKRDLVKLGYRFVPVKGKYGEEEDSYMVMAPEADKESLIRLGVKYNQDSILYSAQNKNELVYTSGKNKGKANAGTGFEKVPTADDFFTEFVGKDGKRIKFTLGLDFSRLVAQALAIVRRRLSAILK